MCCSTIKTSAAVLLAVCVVQSGHSSGAAAPDEIKHGGSIRAVVFSRDGKLVLTASEDRTARVWDTRTGKPVSEPMAHDDIVKAVAFSPDARIVATASGDQTARLWDARTGKALGKAMRHEGPVNAIVFTPDGKQVVTGSDDAKAQRWDATTGEPVGPALQHPDRVVRVAVLPDGKTLLTCCKDQTVRKWDMASREQIAAICAGQMFNSMSASSDGRVLLTGSRDAGCRFWDIAAEKPLTPQMLDNVQFADCGLSPDGRMYYTCTFPLEAERGIRPACVGRLWETATLNQIGESFENANAVAFHPNGRFLALGTREGVVRILDLPGHLEKSISRRGASLDALWDDLANEDATRAYQAVFTLAAISGKALPLLQRQLRRLCPKRTEKCRLA